jgi:peptidoglycan biosynthesis protein MviN/MurJ (putative lipid II flippase)
MASVVILTYLQSRYVVQTYGAGRVLDDYYLATTVPMSMAAMFGVVVTALLVPALTQQLDTDGRTTGALRVIGVATIVLACLVLLAVPIAQALGLWGSSTENPVAAIAICAGAIAYGLSFVAQSYLVATRRLPWFLVAQGASNVAFVALLALGLESTPNGIYLAFAGGAAAQAIVAWGAVAMDRARVLMSRGAHTGLRIRARMKRGLPAVVAAVLVAQAGVVADRWYMKAAGVGAITCLLLSDRIVQVIVTSGLNVVSLQVFPKMTSTEEGRRFAGLAVSNAGGLMVPVSAGLVLSAGAVIDLLFLGGNFSSSSAQLSAHMLQVLSLGLPALAVIQLAARRLQFAGAYWWHVLLLSIGFGVNLGLKPLLEARWGAIGLVAATTMGAVCAAVGYCIVLSTRDRSFSFLDLRDLVASVSAGALALLVGSNSGLPELLTGVLAATAILGVMALARVRSVVWLRSGRLPGGGDA